MIISRGATDAEVISLTPRTPLSKKRSGHDFVGHCGTEAEVVRFFGFASSRGTVMSSEAQDDFRLTLQVQEKVCSRHSASDRGKANLSQFGQTPILARVETALAGIGMIGPSRVFQATAWPQILIDAEMALAAEHRRRIASLAGAGEVLSLEQ